MDKAINATAFESHVNAAIEGAFPGQSSHHYAAVKVLMIRWEIDELEVENDCKELEHVLATKFKFDVERVLLKPQKAQLQLLKTIVNLINDFAHSDTLFIIHYSGHGTVTSKNDALWRCYRDDPRNPVNWTSLSSQIEQCESDALYLIDSCCAAMATPQEISTNKIEVIAACGVENNAYGGPDAEINFTNQLRIALLDMLEKEGRFSAVMLHSRVFQQVRDLAGSYDKKRKAMTWRMGRTPTHFLLTNDENATSILLLPLNEHHEEITKNDEEDSYFAVDENGNYLRPRVLIKMHLKEDFSTQGAASKFAEWLRSFPLFASYVKVEAAYGSYSTIMMLSLPLAVWQMMQLRLPTNLCFITFITTLNLHSTTPEASLAGSSQKQAGVTQLHTPETSGEQNAIVVDPQQEPHTDKMVTN